MSKRYKYIGKDTPRIDATEIVTGKADFIRDIVKPRHMLYGKILRSPYPHALIKRIDGSKAEALPGVKAVTRGIKVAFNCNILTVSICIDCG